MRIGYICHVYPIGSYIGGVFVHELARATVSLGHEVHVLVPANEGSADDVELDGVKIYQRLPALKMMHQRSIDDSYVSLPRITMMTFMLRGMMELKKFVAQYELDIVHAHWAIPTGLVATASRWLHNKPVVITAHGRDLRLYSLSGQTRPPTWARPFTKLALSSADKVIFTTPDYATLGCEFGANEERSSIIRNGVDLSRFGPHREPEDLHQRLQLDSGDSLLLNVGSLDQKKGLFVLLDALKILVDSGESVHLALVGDGPLREPLKAKIKDLDLEKNATMLGDIRHEQLPGIFAACDIYVQPSLIEPFGVVVLEAAASAKPVVVTNVPGMREVITDDVATLVPPGEESELAKAIQNLLGNPELRAKNGANARQLVEANYSWRSVARDTVDVYQDVLDLGNSKSLS